jgi:glycine oxidase
VEGLIVATGHYRNGILLAPITAEVVADLLAGHPPSIDLTPFDPMRVPQAIESAG